RSRLQLADDGGVADLPIAKIYSRMDNLGYVTEGKLTFFKNKFSPQWRFLVHTLLHCLSTKFGSWDQFGSPLAVALICLSDGRGFNWSSYIFKGMVSNIGNAKKFLMYPRFLQKNLGIETRVTRQYKVLMFSSKLFANMRLNFAGHPMPLLPAMLLQAQAGEGAESRETDPDHFTNVEDAPVGGTFHISPPRSTHAPPAGHPSGGEEDPITLTALSSVVSNLVHKVHSLETELKDYKKLFKDVVGKLVKKVKTLEVKLKTKKRKIIGSDSDQEDCGKQDVDLDALHALANAAVTVDSNIPSGSTSRIPDASLSVPTVGPPGASTVLPATFDVLPGSFNVPPFPSAIPTGASTVPAGSPNVPTDVPSSVAHAGISCKGKSLMVEEDIPVKARTFKQMEEDRLCKEAAKRAQAKANASLSKTLLGDDVSEDNFPARMAVLIKKKRQALAAKLVQERQSRPNDLGTTKSLHEKICQESE
nr:hypothetical protein [Tanacetum cinerariifolium]